MQLNIRVSPATKAKLAHNARLMGQHLSEYARGLLEKDEELITGAEIHRRATRRLRQLRRQSAAA